MPYNPKSAQSAAKMQWRFGGAAIHKVAFPDGVPEGTFAALLPWKYAKRGTNQIAPNSQPDAFLKVGVALKDQLICVDQSQAVVTSNNRVIGVKNVCSTMSKVVKKYDCSVVDYDGMRSPQHEVQEVTKIIEALNAKPHSASLLVNCSRRENGMLTTYIKGTTLDFFKKNAEFKHAIRKGANHTWEVISRPQHSLTSRTLMETFVLYKSYNPKVRKYGAGIDKGALEPDKWRKAGLKAWATRQRNAAKNK